MKNAIKYAATMHYEWHPTERDTYAIHVRFPDLLEIGLPAFTVGNDPEDALAAAQEILGTSVEHAAEVGLTLPDPTSIEKLSVDRSLSDLSEPFRIVVEYVSL